MQVCSTGTTFGTLKPEYDTWVDESSKNLLISARSSICNTRSQSEGAPRFLMHATQTVDSSEVTHCSGSHVSTYAWKASCVLLTTFITAVMISSTVMLAVKVRSLFSAPLNNQSAAKKQQEKNLVPNKCPHISAYTLSREQRQRHCWSLSRASLSPRCCPIWHWRSSSSWTATKSTRIWFGSGTFAEFRQVSSGLCNSAKVPEPLVRLQTFAGALSRFNQRTLDTRTQATWASSTRALTSSSTRSITPTFGDTYSKRLAEKTILHLSLLPLSAYKSKLSIVRKPFIQCFVQKRKKAYLL